MDKSPAVHWCACFSILLSAERSTAWEKCISETARCSFSDVAWCGLLKLCFFQSRACFSTRGPHSIFSPPLVLGPISIVQTPARSEFCFRLHWQCSPKLFCSMSRIVWGGGAPGDPCRRPAIPCSFSPVAGGLEWGALQAQPARLALWNRWLPGVSDSQAASPFGPYPVGCLREWRPQCVARGHWLCDGAWVFVCHLRWLRACSWWMRPSCGRQDPECTAPRGLVTTFVIGSNARLFGQLAGDFHWRRWWFHHEREL